MATSVVFELSLTFSTSVGCSQGSPMNQRFPGRLKFLDPWSLVPVVVGSSPHGNASQLDCQLISRVSTIQPLVHRV